jgi:hypothetical protein
MMDIQINHFSIADLGVDIIFNDTSINKMSLIPSYEPFRINEVKEPAFIKLTVDDTLKPIDKKLRERIRDFDTGNGVTVVDETPDGYQFIIRDIRGYDCCMLQSNHDFTDCYCALNGNFDMRRFGLNNALMLVYAFASSRKDTLLVHASLVRKGDYGYAFIAKSGTGKSTQVSMWLRYIEGCDLMNDDNPIIRIIDGKPYIYGSPWSGKTPCYRNVKAKLGAVTRIDRAPANSIDKLSPIEAFASFLPSCSSMKWDKEIFGYVCDTVTKVVETTGIYTLHCLPNREAAEVCHAAIAIKDE